MANVLPTQMSGIPPTVLDTLPALQPPAGVRSDFVSPDDRGYVLNATATVLFGFMLCLFANRVYTKVSIVREASWDDCTLLGPVGKHQWDVRLVDAMSGNIVTTNAIMVFLSPLTLLFAKLTFFLMYFHIFWPLRWLRVTVYVGASLTCAFYGAVSVAQVVLLTPRYGQTWLEHSLSKESRKDQVLYVYIAAVGLGFDILLLVMPLVAVLGLQKPKQRKKGFLFIFFIGIFACVGCLLSVYFRVVNQRSPDITWNLMPVKLVALVEIFIGISCACMPAFSRMLQHHRPALEKFCSVLSPRSLFSRLTTSGDAANHAGFQPFGKESPLTAVKWAQGPYSRLEGESSSSRDGNVQPNYELRQVQNGQERVEEGRGGG